MRQKKVLIVGDSPALATGFGKVHHEAAKVLLSNGYKVGYVAGQEYKGNESNLDLPATKFLPKQGDTMGFLATFETIKKFKPDVVFHTGDPGTFTAFTQVVPTTIPLIGYVPIEGEPIIEHQWKGVLRDLHWFTCSAYGSQVAKTYLNKDVEYAYHGIDHEVFKINGRRDEVRQSLGWTDKFVIMCVATNVRRKQWPRLFEALAILKQRYNQKDIVLYAHTVPFDNYWLEGWHLPGITKAYDIYNEVVFNPKLDKHNAKVDETDFSELPSLVDMYNAADLFVLPSQVEGFGLPIAEAMACGLPVMVTRYGAGWEVASPAGVGLIANDWEIHKSGTRYANVDPSYMAKEILALKRNPKERARRVKLGLERVKDFNWDRFKELLLDGVENTKAYEGSQIQSESSSASHKENAEKQTATRNKAPALSPQ